MHAEFFRLSCEEFESLRADSKSTMAGTDEKLVYPCAPFAIFEAVVKCHDDVAYSFPIGNDKPHTAKAGSLSSWSVTLEVVGSSNGHDHGSSTCSSFIIAISFARSSGTPLRM